MIKTRSYLSIGLLILCVLLPIGTAMGQSSLNPILKPYLSDFNLPAIAAAMITIPSLARCLRRNVPKILMSRSQTTLVSSMPF